MSSILEELKKKRAEEGKSYLDISTKNDYSSVEKADKERQEQLKALEEAVAKLRTPYIDYKENPNTIQSISLEDESFSRPAGDTIQSNQGNNPSKLGPNLISGLGKVALTIDTTKDTAIAGVANQLANAKALGMEIGSISAEQLYNYAKGKHNITNTVAVKRLEGSEAAKSAAPVAIMLDEIKKGTYKGTIEDIEKTLKYGNDVTYTKWYNQKIAPSVNRAKASQAANTSMYGNTAGGIMNFGANAVSGIGQFAANTVLGGPIYAGAMAGLSRDSSGNVQQIRNEGLDQVAKDIGVDVGLGAFFSYLMGEGTGAINSAIQNSIPKSVLSKAGIIAKNVVAGAGGAYASVGTTGTLRNIYNKLQGREVSQEDALKPWWSTDTAIATFMGALFNGISGSKSDLAKAEQIKAVMNKQGELNARLTGLSKDIAKQFEAGNQQGIETSYNSGKQAIEEFFNRNNLGKFTNTLKNEYLKQWFEYNYDLGIKYENLTNPSATNTTPRIGPSLPTVARPAQQAMVVPPPSTLTTVPQAQPSTGITPSATQGTVLTKENYYDVLRAATPLLDEKEVTEETLRLMDNYDLGAFDDRALDKIQRQAEKNVFDKFAQTDEGKRLIASYKDGELQPIKAEKKDFSGGYTTAEGTPITNGIAKWAKESAMKTDGKPDSYYHGSPFLFEEFKDTYTHNGKSLGDGYYLSKNKDWVKKNYAYSKGDKVYELVLNVKNPFNEEAWLKDKENIIKEAPQIAETFFPNVSPETFAEDIEYGRYFKDEEPTAYDTVKTITEYAQKNGVDTRKIWDWLGYDGIDIDGEVVIFKSNQAKYLDNPYPTSRPAFVAEPEADFPTDMSSKQMLERYSQLTNGRKIDYKAKEVTLADGTKMPLDDYNNEVNKLRKVWENKVDDVKELQGENSTQGSFSMPKNLPEELPAERRKFLKEFKQVGYVNIKGVKVTSVDDLADVAQVFRDPIAETFRVIFMKGDTIVGQSGYTTGSVRAVGIGNNRRFAGQIDLWADGFGADGYYLIHNHPDGRVEPSSGDIGVTRHLASYTNIPLKGHVIIDHNEFSAIYRNGTTQKHIKLRNNTYNEIEKDFSKEGWANTPVENMDQIAALSSYVKNDEDFSTVIWTDSKFVPTVLQSLPNSFFESNSRNKVVEYMQKVGRENGADYVMFATQKPSAFMNIKEKAPNTPAIVLYVAKSDGSLSIGSASRSQQLHLYNNNRKNSQQIAPMAGIQMQEPSTSLEEIKKQYEPKQPDKNAFKQRIVDELKDIPGVEKVYLSKENKQGNWGVYVKGKQKVVFSKGFPTDWSYETYIPAYENGKPTDEKYIKEAIDIAKEELKRAYAKKEPPKKLEPPKKKEQPEKTKKKEPIKRLEKKQPEPDKRLGFDAIDKDKEALEKANDKLRDELAKQKENYEKRLKKKDEELEQFKQKKKEQKEKQKIRLAKKESKRKEEQRFKGATPKGKLRMLGRKIEKQTGYYEINNYPELDKKYEEEFGKTIRQTIQTLKTRDIYPYLPAKFQDIVDTFADETYLKANWKTFDKYVREALQIDEIKKLIEESDTPVAQKLLGIVREHKTAPITIKTAKEMYEDLQILEDIVELAQERLDYRRQPENWEKVLDKSAEALEELEKTNTPKKLTPKSAKRERKFDNFKKLPETFQTLKTRIQSAFGGNPNSPLKVVWDWFEEGREREAMLDSKFAENFDGLVEKAAGGWKFAGELEKDFAEDAPYIDTGITGTNPKTGKPYEENAKLPKDIIMHIVASSKNDDNLMSFCKILLGTDYRGNPVYSNPGGYIVPNEYYMKRGKIGEAYEKGKKYVFTKKDIEHLEGMLTETEKKFVEAALRVGDITAQYGNEVSQKLIGRDLFSVKNYIRIIRDLSTFDGELIDPTKLDNLANATSDKYVGIGGILGRGGSLEGRNHRSTRPIYGESLKQSVEKSFGGAKKYIAYALPLYDTDYILEGRLPDKFEQVEVVDKEPKSTPSLKYVKVDEPPRNGADRTMYYVDNGDSYTIYKVAEKGKTMKQLLTNAGEEGFYDYYKQFVDGLVGRNKKYSKFASTRARVVLNANLRVAATQFFSYFQIGQFLDHPTSSMTKALADKGTIFKLAKDFLESKDVDTSKLKGQRLVNRFLEYVTYTNTQRGLGKFSDDVRYVEAGSTVLGRINVGKLLATVDKFTVDATFRALMYDIMADGTKFGSEEFFKQFKNRLYSIYQSNPQYSAIYRTPLQNKGTAISTALSQFQTVMLQGFNNASQAAMTHEYYKRQGNESEKKKWGKIFKRTVSGLIISGLTLAALKDYLDQLAGKEKDEPYIKRITMSFIQNMLSYTIVGDEIFSALFKFNNYDLTTNELSYFNTALDAIGDMGTLVTKPTPPNAIKLIKSLGQTIGLPTGSIENTFGILSNLTSDNAFKAYSVMKDKNKYEKWLKNQEAIGTDFKTFYEISQAVKEKTLAEKYGYVKGSETGTYGSLSYAKGRAIMDVLGIEQGKKMTKEQKQAYSKWYNIFKD